MNSTIAQTNAQSTNFAQLASDAQIPRNAQNYAHEESHKQMHAQTFAQQMMHKSRNAQKISVGKQNGADRDTTLN